MAEKRKRPREAEGSHALGVAGWIAIVVLAGFLIGAGLYAVHTWNMLAGTAIPPLGWTFMILGAVLTIAVGGGLMGLLFYSSRKGKDF